MSIRSACALLSLTLLASGADGAAQVDAARELAIPRQPAIVAFLVANLDSRWSRDYYYLKTRLHAIYPSAFVYVYNAAGDPVRQLGQAEEALGKGAKVLIVVAAAPTTAAAIVTVGHRSGAKVIAYDHTIKSTKVDLFDSFDAAAVGNAQAHWLAANVRRGGTIVTINGPKSGSNSQTFQRRYLATLGPSFRNHYFRNGGVYWTPNWSSMAAGRLMALALQRNHSRVQGVLAADDDLADGAISALQLVGSQGRTKVTGQDATIGALRHILEGEQSMTVYKPVYEEAFVAAAAANAFLRGRTLSAALGHRLTTTAGFGKAVLLQPVVITRSNAKKAFDDGHATKKEVCQGPVLRKLCSGL